MICMFFLKQRVNYSVIIFDRKYSEACIEEREIWLYEVVLPEDNSHSEKRVLGFVVFVVVTQSPRL